MVQKYEKKLKQTNEDIKIYIFLYLCNRVGLSVFNVKGAYVVCCVSDVR